MGKKPESVDIQSIYQSAVTLHQQGEISRAVTLYLQVLHHFPDVAAIHYNLGLARFELEQFAGAIEAYNRAAELNPVDSDIFYNLGLACKMARQYDQAEKAYLRALELADNERDILYNLGCCYQDAGAIEQACLVYERLLELAPDHVSGVNNLAYLQHLRKNFAQAKKLYARVLELDPHRRSAQHMLAALSGKVEQGPPREYIRELFDQYSENFEENLVKDLEYNTYCILRQAIDALPGKKSRYDHGLDIGCGTGLAGEAFHSICARLSGIDLSANMIGQSAEKNLYDELHCAEVIEFLGRTNHEYDLLIAADVVPYLGNLEPLFAAAAQSAAENAHFCLSSEKTEKPGWNIRPTGRYAHNPEYIAHTAAKNGWVVLERFRANIRREHDAWIRGTIFVLEKRTRYK
ncbi:MAG: tetratricopeptide repeat protein [Desulfobulbaceae bacterium]|nr:tetratricopeptide repeat protein [Desulfobulbaceae bacterium]